MSGVTVKGLDELDRKMRRLAGSKIVDQTLENYARLVEEDVKPYPPESEANRPPVPYYERGQGTVTASGLRKTSQDMMRKWKVQTGSRIALENAATYSGYVQGLSQVGYHKARGWKNAYERAEQMLDKIHGIFATLFRKEWR